MQSQSTDTEHSLLSVLECPVCAVYIKLPIILCANGHKICEIYKQKVRQYPSCRQQFVNTRNLALDDLAR
jgi:hypothetical protein